MQNDKDTTGAFRFADRRQERIYQRLRENVGPGPASFFLDACRFMQDPLEFDSTSHLVGHCLREIESGMREVLVGSGFKQLPTKTAVDEVEEILSALGVDEDESVASLWVDIHRRRLLPGKAHRRDLRKPRVVDEDFEQFWEEMQTVLDIVLNRFEAHYTRVFSTLDELLEIERPTGAQVQQLRNQIPNNLVTRSYFFDRLEHLDWLQPLKARGFFRTPPSQYKDPVSGELKAPAWPEARYLARMGEQRPKEVREIIESADESDNPRVHEAFVNATLNMPSGVAKQLSTKVIKWLQGSGHYYPLSERATELVVHLAREGETATGLKIARALFTLERETSSPLLPRPQSRMTDWQYRRNMERVGDALGAAAPVEWFETLCESVSEALLYSQRSDDGSEDSHDHSYIWRPAIEEHDQNERTEDVRNVLVTALRKQAELLIEKELVTVADVLRKLDARKSDLFVRLGLHLIRFADVDDEELLRKALVDRESFDAPGIHHEYYRLLERTFPNLNKETRETILGWIEDGPEREDVMRWLGGASEREPNEEEIEERSDLWRYRKLMPLEEHLSASWKSRFKEYERRFGTLEHPEFLSYSGGVWVGPTSPHSSEELKRLSVEETVRVLREWEPSGEWSAPTPEGLSRNLAQVIAAEPQKYAIDAMLFVDLEPTYVRAVIDGVANAVKDGRAFTWEGVLGLARWVVQQPRSARDEAGNIGIGDRDPHWGWTRQSVARLLGAGLSDDKLEIPFDLRTVVMEIIERLAEDPDPTPQHEEEYGGSNMDPHSLSINTVRGEAIHTVVRYALWVYRNMKKRRKEVEIDFSDMPEVQEILEKHLDSDVEPALAVRAVYGRWFPQLVLLDKEWAAEVANEIFPLDPESEAFWSAAWDTYVRTCRPHYDVLEVLEDHYREAIDQLEGADSDEITGSEKGLAGHLMTYYWRGELKAGIDDRKGLVRRFFEKASPEVRGYAIEFIGRSLENTESDIPSEILDRLRNLWELRLALAREAPGVAEFEPELEAFGWWFWSGQMDAEWSLQQLAAAVGLSTKLRQSSGFVLERLVDVADGFPEDSMECLELILERDVNQWLPMGRKSEIQALLRIGLSAGGKAEEHARAVVSRLASKGYHEFRTLLP